MRETARPGRRSPVALDEQGAQSLGRAVDRQPEPAAGPRRRSRSRGIRSSAWSGAHRGGHLGGRRRHQGLGLGRHDDRGGRRGGALDHAGDRLLRPRDRRRRPGRSRRGGLRRVARDCAPCWSSDRRPAARPASRPGSRTTWASPTASPGPSSPTGLAGRRPSSAPRSSRPATSPRLRTNGPARVLRFGDGIEVAAHAVDHRDRRLLPGPGRARASASSPAGACSTAPRRPRPRTASTPTSTSSAAPTPPARRRCSSPGWPSRSRSWCAATSSTRSMSHYLIEQLDRDRQHRHPCSAPWSSEAHGDGHLEA